MGFRLAYTPDIPALMNAVAKHGSLEAFAQAFDAAPKKKDGRWFGPISVLAMCAAYSPDATQPLGVALPPGEHFEYTSGCILKTQWGTMHGTYQMHREGGGQFDAEIAPFLLAHPSVGATQLVN